MEAGGGDGVEGDRNRTPIEAGAGWGGEGFDLGVMFRGPDCDLGVMLGPLRAVSGGETDVILAMGEFDGENADMDDDDDEPLDDRGVPLLEERRCSHSGEARGVHAEGASTS